MNVDGDSSSHVNQVRSKYFTRVHMDESLTDFQESKKINIGPKISKAITKKRKNKTKRIKGQKDIRSILRGKKDELVTYTKKFDAICRTSGVDVDPEQLQIAIALSKSLQSEPLTTDCILDTNISTQEKTRRIRNTLQEYGFKVPETKITKKRLRRSHKYYKLFSCADDEKQQVISDRFSQVLLQNIWKFKPNSLKDVLNTPLYYISTNVTYTEIKNNDLFYINGLLDKTKSFGSLLRNWADIPGRPSSPMSIEYYDLNFNEIEWSQSELDSALSGSLDTIKTIMTSKQKESLDKNVDAPRSNTDGITNYDKCEIPHVESQLLNHEYRSCSPDLFEDETSFTFENSKNNATVFKGNNSDVIYLTKCVNITDNTEIIETIKECHNLNISNLGKEKSNDCIGITECVASTSGCINPLFSNRTIYPTQSCNNNDITLCDARGENNEIDLTQSSNSSNELPIVHLSQKSLDDTIIVNACDYDNIINSRENTPVDDKQDFFDLTQGCNITELHEGNSSFGGQSIFDDYCYGHSDHSEENSNNKFINNKGSNANTIDAEIDLSETVEISNNISCYKRMNEISFKNKSLSINDKDSKIRNRTNTEVKKVDIESCNSNYYTIKYNNISDKTINLDVNKQYQVVNMPEPLLYDPSHAVLVKNEQFSSKSQLCTNLNNDIEKIEDKIDLTQHSADIYSDFNKSPENMCNSSLDAKYRFTLVDKITDQSQYYSPGKELSSSKSTIYKIADDFCNVDKVANCLVSDEALGLSQNSEVFEILDNELNYSILQSRHEIDNAGNVSVIDNFSITQTSDVIDLDIEHRNDLHNLPEINLIGTQAQSAVSSCITDNDNSNLKSPKSNKFIIKTNDVTPIKDFALMSTPERNNELDKYGIKPFKRKRAIQLLTYIYNQTHPIVSDNLDYVHSPPKKTKRVKSPRISQKNLKSPEKLQTRQNLANNGNNVYEVTNELPVIRDLESSVEDFVFQRREKAKVHSCRVPLHVAFHNYVSCRRSLREAILRYEPVNIDIIHKELVGCGHRYDPKDLLKFMDKKCITVKTVDNYGRNNKKKLNITES